MESAFEALEREVNSNRNRDSNRQPSNNSAPVSKYFSTFV